MALFSKDSENNPKFREAPKPTTPAAAPTASPTAPQSVSPEERPAARPFSHQPAPASAEARAYLDKGSKISGKLFFEGPVRIDGQVDGEISSSDAVVVGESAVITAQVKAASVVIAGKISGDIIAGKRVEIRPTAKVFGNLTSPVLVVHDGALFEGHCTMNAEVKNAEVKDDRKVTPMVAKEERVVAQVAVGGNKA
ncbi:MAG TPA: polymer-forming cytoskeletal protein [Candidatus Binataceae bacterium]|jgi:cytoskeletal protein CcmA (bactofilin family)|nr:polymer-forming cytoskeletal protein [Candidatus Binataceae bacterium]